MSIARRPGKAGSDVSHHNRHRRSNTIAAGLAALGLLAGGLSACGQEETAQIVLNDEATGVQQISPDNVSAATAAASQLAFASSDVAVLGTEEDAAAVADKAKDLGAPALLVSSSDTPPADASSADASSADGPASSASPTASTSGGAGHAADGDAISEELDRLGVTTVFAPDGEEEPDAAGERDIVAYDPETLEPEDGKAPEITVEGDAAPATLFVLDTDNPTPAQEVASASIEAAAGTVTTLADPDPRASSETVKAAKASNGDGVLALGQDFGNEDQFASRLATARTAPELPGGGQTPFPGRRMVAAYGSPGIPELGVLGEQDLDESMDLVEDLAAEYDPYSKEQVIPAMEIITTVASASEGADGNYSSELDPETIRPWIERAADEGVYVVLDLQPGTSPFIDQAKMYEDLLKEPNVGLALDSEWRLKEGQKHMEQIGTVDSKEINETADWLADLTSANDLPQKVFIMHQFSTSMITHRENIDTSHDGLAMVLHADGHGSPGMKMQTWNTLQDGLPEGIRMAWKNFYDEDDPTFTPEETMDVEPRPWFVSYQ